MSKTEKMTERVTVKMDANLKAKLQREAERCGGDMSAYIRSLIEKRHLQAIATEKHHQRKFLGGVRSFLLRIQKSAFVMLLNNFSQLRDALFEGEPLFENTAGSCDKNICTGLGEQSCVFKTDVPIHFNFNIRVPEMI